MKDKESEGGKTSIFGRGGKEGEKPNTKRKGKR